MNAMRTFSARETHWLQQLDGIELAGFWQRAWAFFIDWTLVNILSMLIFAGGIFGYLALRQKSGHPPPLKLHLDLKPERFNFTSSEPQLDKRLDSEWMHILIDFGVPVLYFGLLSTLR